MTKIVYYLNRMACTCLLCAGMLLTGCYDDSEILESLKNQQEQIDELKALCSEYNASIESLQAVVSALQAKDYVTGISPVKQGSEVVGYTISFEKSGAVTIYHGKDGADGIDGHTPVIGVKQWTDGLWYWTIDGDWLLDSEGNKVKASGTDGADGEDGKDGAGGTNGFTPVLKIEDGYWYVSYDGGKTYGTTPVGQATGDAGYTMFEEVTYDEGYVYVTMTDGTTLKLPRTCADDMIDSYGGVTISVRSQDVRNRSIVLYGNVSLADNYTADEFGIVYSVSDVFSISNATFVPITDLNDGEYSMSLSVMPGIEYFCTTYIKQGDFYKYGEAVSFVITDPGFPTDYTNLALKGTANCYIVSEAGGYYFLTVKGNSYDYLNSVQSAEVIWESFGTDVVPNVGDLIESVSYGEDYIKFRTADTFREGNAVVAAKDAEGNILWSWHIWLTDQPAAHVYKNDAGTMMDRNLGATSATPGDIGALGLLYQWGRKDPFLGSSSISSRILAKSTITWPTAVSSSSSTGTVDYVTSYPTTYVIESSFSRGDWHYSSRDNTLWTTSDKIKSIYDPCPAGWRVPDGGSYGVWSKAGFDDTKYDSANEGMSFSISSPSTTWYPALGVRSGSNGVQLNGNSYWSASPDSYDSRNACYLYFGRYGDVFLSSGRSRASGCSVRCIQVVDKVAGADAEE